MNSVMEHTNVDSSNTIRVFTYDDELKNTYFKKGKNGLRICKEPDPDATATYADGLSVGDPFTGGQASANNSVGGVSLGGRNPEVLIARELLFRACELTLNLDANYNQSRHIYSEFLEAAKAISKTQTGTGSKSTSSNITVTQTQSVEEEDDEDSDDTSSSDSSDN